MRGLRRAAFGLAVAAFLAVAVDAATQQTAAAPRQLHLTAGKSIVIDSPVEITRVSVANPETLEAVGVSPREVVLNGREPGETSVIVWQQGGSRLLFDVTVHAPTRLIDAVRKQLEAELPGQDVSIAVEDGHVFLRGTVDDMTSSDRAVAIASTLGEPVNLLRVKVPEQDEQILLKVKFASVDRTAVRQLGVNWFSTGAGNTIGRISTGQFPAPVPRTPGPGTAPTWSLSDALNIFIFRPDLDFGATMQLLQERGVLEILAEPNVLAINGKRASFLAGGEFPFPVVQGGVLGGFSSVTIEWREFGIRLDFRPRITPRGTIRLTVAPEVSSLDFANGLSFQGFVIPALASRKVSTEIELNNGQSFAIAGLLDNRIRENLRKIPGLGDIPFFGKLFQSQELEKNKSELLVLVTPEIVHPIPANQEKPSVEMPKPFLEGGATSPPRTPGIEVTGETTPTPPRPALPVEELKRIEEELAAEPEESGRQPGFVPYGFTSRGGGGVRAGTSEP